MKLPSKDEINIYNSLDEIAATEHFLNKTVEQAESLFRENSACYQEDLMWMGIRAFNFYLQSVNNYLQSYYSVGDGHLIDCFYEIVMFRLDENEFSLAIKRVNQIIDYVINNYNKFDVNKDVYGDLIGKYRQLQIQLQTMGSESEVFPRI